MREREGGRGERGAQRVSEEERRAQGRKEGKVWQ